MSNCSSLRVIAEDAAKVKKERDFENTGQYTLNPAEFFANRFLSIDDALSMERANVCMNRCQEPVRVLKAVISANLKEINLNLANCV